MLKNRSVSFQPEASVLFFFFNTVADKKPLHVKALVKMKYRVFLLQCNYTQSANPPPLDKTSSSSTAVKIPVLFFPQVFIARWITYISYLL